MAEIDQPDLNWIDKYRRHKCTSILVHFGCRCESGRWRRRRWSKVYKISDKSVVASVVSRKAKMPLEAAGQIYFCRLLQVNSDCVGPRHWWKRRSRASVRIGFCSSRCNDRLLLCLRQGRNQTLAWNCCAKSPSHCYSNCCLVLMFPAMIFCASFQMFNLFSLTDLATFLQHSGSTSERKRFYSFALPWHGLIALAWYDLMWWCSTECANL